MLVVQLSDLHLRAPGKLLYRQIDTAAHLASAIERIAALAPVPDAVVVSGDLTDRGGLDEYDHLREHLGRLSVPWYLMPGNHDDRDNLRRAFPGQAWRGDGLCCQRVDLPDATLLLLDTIVPGEEGGALAEPQMAWLESACPRDTPCLLFLHHPPVATGIAGMDAIGLRGADRLSRWLEGRPNLRLLAAGHVHRMICAEFAGRPLVIAPSPAHQIAFDLTGDADALAWCREPGGFVAHRFDGQRFVSHFIPCMTAETTRYA